jgi:hypothetical protein
MQEKQKDKEFIPITIPGITRRRFSDCCNGEILDNRCSKCGNWLEHSEGRREIVIKGIDGKTPNPNAKKTNFNKPTVLVSMIDDKPKEEDKMPQYFKDLKSRSGVNILSWSDSSV